MTRTLVTGCAGFIGSTLTDALLARGDDVLGVDCFTPYYARTDKEANLVSARCNPRFELAERDLGVDEIADLLDGVEVVFHQAAQAGVRPSWSRGFSDYASHNVVGTQRLLEAVAGSRSVRRIVYASSSSVYGQAPAYPTRETDLPRPHSPYGVTKLAAEHLCGLYAANWGVPSVALRYFTVYGPRQRPDMAMHRLVEAGLQGCPFPLYGDGSAIRDFTYIDDVVAANLAAADACCAPGTVLNIAGGGSIAMAELLELAGELVGQPIPLDRRPRQAGDVDRTGGAIDEAAVVLGWAPLVDVRTGLSRQVEWHLARSGRVSMPAYEVPIS